MNLKVQVWIYCWDRAAGLKLLLLLTRPERGSFWQPVTGGVELDEVDRPLRDAAWREACEESGIALPLPPYDLDKSFSYEKYGKIFEEHAFAVECRSTDKGEPPNPQLDANEHVESRWVTPAEALQMTRFPSNIEVLKALLAKLRVAENGASL